MTAPDCRNRSYEELLIDSAFTVLLIDELQKHAHRLLDLHLLHNLFFLIAHSWYQHRLDGLCFTFVRAPGGFKSPELTETIEQLSRAGLIGWDRKHGIALKHDSPRLAEVLRRHVWTVNPELYPAVSDALALLNSRSDDEFDDIVITQQYSSLDGEEENSYEHLDYGTPVMGWYVPTGLEPCRMLAEPYMLVMRYAAQLDPGDYNWVPF
jgi:hypothetical protein